MNDDIRIRKFKAFLAAKHLSAATVRAYAGPIRKLLRIMDEHKHQRPEAKLVEQFRRSLQGQVAIATRLLHDSALRAYLDWLCNNGAVLSNPMAGMRSPKLRRLAHRTTLTDDEVNRMLAVPDTRKPLGLRNRAILEILYSCAIRHQELLGLSAYDLDLKGGFLMVRAGKGGRDRKVPIGKAAVHWVTRYLEAGRANIGTIQSSASLLLSREGNAMGQKEVCRMIHAVARQAGIKKKVTPHMFRHTAATEMVRNGAALRHVQELLGHRSLATTQIYTKVTNPDLKAMILTCHPSMRLKTLPIQWPKLEQRQCTTRRRRLRS